MFKWLNKNDFSDYVQLTVNIDDRFIDTAVKDAHEFDVVPVLSDSMLTAMQAVLETNPAQWNKNKTYAIDDIVFLDSVYYKCLVSNTDSSPAPLNTDWAEIELLTFWIEYVKPYFVLSAYSRFLLWHGANITQFGARQINEDISVEITDKRRGELLADVGNKVNVYLSRLNKYFASVDGTFDSVKYERDSEDNEKPRGGFKIWGVGGKKIEKCPNENN